MRRARYTFTALVVALLLTGTTAQAARDMEWCAEDPVFKVFGSHFRLTTTIAAAASAVDGVEYVVTLPSNAEGSATVRFPRGARIGTTVTFRYTGPAYGGTGTFGVDASVLASASVDAAVRVELSGPSVAAATFTGSTNRTIASHFDVAGK